MFTFNGVTAETMGLEVAAVRRSVMPDVERSTIEVPGRAGAYLMNVGLAERRIEIDVVFTASTTEGLMSAARTLASYLYAERPLELAFEDEPNVVYFATIDDDTDLETLGRYRAFTLTFICPDPYAYAETEAETALVLGENTVANGGGVATFPRFELDVLTADTTFVEVACEDTGEFVRVGNPVPIDEDASEPKSLVWLDRMSSMDWTPMGSPDPGWTWLVSNLNDHAENPMIMDTNGFSFSPQWELGDFGTSANTWHGPTVYRDVTGDALQDFEIRMVGGVDTRNDPLAMGLVSIYLMTTGDPYTPVCKVHLVDMWSSMERVVCNAILGAAADDYTVFSQKPDSGSSYTTLNRVPTYITISRVGTRWRFHIFRRDHNQTGDPEDNPPLLQSWVQSYYDVDEAYTDTISRIAINVSTFGTNPEPTSVYCHDVRVERLATAADYPVIASAGQKVSIDNRQGLVLIDGSPFTSIDNLPVSAFIDLGSSFFELPTGNSTVRLSVDDGAGMTGTAYVRKRWL